MRFHFARSRLVSRYLGGRLLRTPLPGFDEEYYVRVNIRLPLESMTPLEHYLRHGWREGRDPSAGFSTRGYLAANPDVAASGVNPLLHFLEHGLSEGRTGWQKPGAWSGSPQAGVTAPAVAARPAARAEGGEAGPPEGR
ncbi:hypothetical protein [Methylobacterium variabile]|jgi:hypothetical protein|uniref:hypothetical protein n=1 Tax=Methylobacterium variabile TaxID=298794 RepID=UPI00069EB1BF|nr:hypothetical protein [Methylobacterium variabile]